MLNNDGILSHLSRSYPLLVKISLFLLLLLLSYGLAAITLERSVLIGLSILAGVVLFLSFMSLEFGLKMMLLASVLTGWFSKIYDSIPFGVTLDLMLGMLLIRFLISKARNSTWSFEGDLIGKLILIWIVLNLIQVANPYAVSSTAWLFCVRSMALLFLVYFIACHVFDSYNKIISNIKYILALGVMTALYGLKQEFLGYTDFELNWLYSDPLRAQLIIQWSRIRPFSFCSDPTTFGIYMTLLGTLSLVLSFGAFKIRYRMLLFFAGIIMFLSMFYGGSRTPMVLVPVGLIIYALLTLKKEVFVILSILGIIGTGLILKSTGSAVMYRIKSAFIPSLSEDTMLIREENRTFIQPYIHTHPIGLGLGRIGIWGDRFSPDDFLAGFAHDSGLLRIAIELGWLYLIFYMFFLFICIRTSIYYYVRVRNPKIKVIYLGLTVVLFQIIIGSYVQEVIPLIPTSITLYVFLAIIHKLKDYDIVVTHPS